VKDESAVINSFQYYERKTFFTKVTLVTLTFEEVNPKHRLLFLTKTTKHVKNEN